MKPIAKVLSQDVFLPSPGPGIGVMAHTAYTRATGDDLVSVHSIISRSDTCDISFVRFSSDNGRTWSAVQERPTYAKTPSGALRVHPRAGFVEPNTGRYVSFRTQGVLPTDDPLEGMKQWIIWYTVSDDGGRTAAVDEPIVQSGPQFSATHPLPGVYTGRNCVMIGDLGCEPLPLADGSFLLPVQITPVGPDGQYYSPGGGFTYTDAAILAGRWAGGRIEWSLRARVAGDPARSTRGMIEPTLALLEGGRLLMVMRGSNDKKPDLPGHKWFSLSDDDGYSWSMPKPWTYDDGQAFHSPSSMSQLLAHSSGRQLWLGNICPNNPKGNSPRWPIILGEVDRRTGLLRRQTVTVLDDHREGDTQNLTLSNFLAREDRRTGQILVHMTRLFAHQPKDWTADAMLYRVQIL